MSEHTTTETSKDPSQLTLPFVDTDLDLLGPLTLSDIIVMAVPAVLLFGAFAALVSGRSTLGLGLGAVGLLALVVAGVATVTDRFYTSPRERVTGWADYLRRRRGLPWGHEEAVDNNVHGVRRIRDDGTVERTDGSLVGFVEIDPTNTAMQTAEESNRLVGQLSQAIDEEIKDTSFKLYSTTRPENVDAIADDYEARAFSDDLAGDETGDHLQRELMHSVAEFQRNEDVPAWDAVEWSHYVVVEATSADATVGEESWLELLNPLNSRSEHDQERAKEQMEQALADRLDTVDRAFSGVDGVTTTRVVASDVVDVVARYWSRDDLDDAGDQLVSKFGATEDEFGVTPCERMLAPGVFDATRGVVEVGDQFARTFWIAEWPTEPESLFLSELMTIQGVNVDVCIHVNNEEKRRVIDDLGHQIADIDAEGMEREENTDPTAMDIDDDLGAYQKMRALLRSQPVQAWQVAGYVTVRASTRDGIQKALDAVESFSDERAAQLRALDEDSDEVRHTLTGTPANTLPIPPGTRQLEAYTSGSPTGRDDYTDVSAVPKTQRVLGAAVGAMFPFCTEVVREPEGIDWGRSTHNGTLLRADPFDRGGSPHLITIAKSRSGKTYSASKEAMAWYASRTDRTLIVCDTQGGFDGVTKCLDGKHIVVDGTETINPLDIQPVPEHVRNEMGGQVDPYGQKIDEATQFFAGILRAQGIDPGEYTATIEDAVETTYRRAGITQHDLDSHARESPTVADFLDTLGEMLESPGEFTHHQHDEEIRLKQRRVADLLDKLSAFKEGGKYEHMVGQTETGLADANVDMAYLDLQQLQGADDAERSVMLQLMLSQVSQKIKRAPGQSIFMIDEAHYLLHSDEMVHWLQKAAREWARYDAAMWFISQSPREFVQQSQSAGAQSENQRRTIVDQCSTIQFFRTPRVERETLEQFGLNDHQIDFVRDRATPGKAGKGYSEGLLSFEDKNSWFPTLVEASEFEHAVLTYSARDDGDFQTYLANTTGFGGDA